MENWNQAEVADHLAIYDLFLGITGDFRQACDIDTGSLGSHNSVFDSRNCDIFADKGPGHFICADQKSGRAVKLACQYTGHSA